MAQYELRFSSSLGNHFFVAESDEEACQYAEGQLAKYPREEWVELLGDEDDSIHQYFGDLSSITVGSPDNPNWF